MPPKRPASPESAVPGVNIFTSSPIIDRQSTFLGYYSLALPPRSLQSLPEAKDASHRILAWRLPSKQQTLTSRSNYDVGHDDDGEQHAGKKLESLMVQLDIQGAIVVARWYGGILLGPVRFEHIEDCAKEAVNLWGNGKKRHKPDQSASYDPQSSPSTVPPPDMRPEELQRRRQELIRLLQRRDDSISTLRTLLEQKKGPQPTASPSAPSPARKVDYDTMPLTRLQALEHARDASIAFLLKEIDRVEKEQADRVAAETEKRQKEAASKAALESEELDEAWAHVEAHMLNKADAKNSLKESSVP